MRLRMACFVLAGVALCCASALRAQVSYTRVAFTGQEAPGAGGAVYHDFDMPLLNDSGRIAFLAHLTGSDRLNDAAIFAGEPAALQAVARTGDSAPGFSDGTVIRQEYLQLQALNAVGQVAFSAGLEGPATAHDDWALYVSGAGQTQQVMRMLGTAPGGGQFTYPSAFRLNDTGTVAFISTLANVPDLTSMGIWVGKPGALQLVARLGQPAPGLPGHIYSGVSPSENDTAFLTLSLSNAGQIAISGFVDTPDYKGSAWASWVGDPNALRLLTHMGDPAPGAGEGVTFSYSNIPFIHPSGRLVAAPGLVDPGHEMAEGNGLYVGDASGMQLVLRNGDPAPGLPGARFSTFDATINSRGEVAIMGYLGTAPAWPRGIWAGDPHHLRLIAADGMEAPGTGGLQFAGISACQLNDLGQVAFFTFLGQDIGSLWMTDTEGNLHLVLRDDQPFDVGGGDYRALRRLFQLDYALDDMGQLAFTLPFKDNTSGIFLAAVPEPGTLAFLGGGVAAMLLRRRR